MITVHINGQAQVFEAQLTLAELLTRIDLAGKRLAVECNGDIVPRSQHGDAVIVDGDRLEIVVAVGGG
ncbi:sulfur carrier protein ThiS [Chitinivorax sp. PXF-14]|uniref:sulfur carrier protein ThiS n=1 Tax=Chitinivorax sp. PXF-14 TaxID=3230488 RepID=UPI003466A5FE